MYKIYLPTEKKNSNIRGYWYNAEGKKFVDFLRTVDADKVSDKMLNDYRVQYSQEAIFVECINKRTGNYNRAIVFYSKDKKEVFNRRITRICRTVSELKNAIRRFRRSDLNCYTIIKEVGYYRLFAWTKKINKAKRINRRNALIKKLFDNCKKVIGYNESIPCKLRISKRSATNRTNRWYNRYTGEVKHVITLNTRLLREGRIHTGYSGSYYEKRGEKLNHLVIGNYKKCLRFVILHELAHAHFNNKYIAVLNRPQNDYNTVRGKIRNEKYADNLALRYIDKI